MIRKGVGKLGMGEAFRALERIASSFRAFPHGGNSRRLKYKNKSKDSCVIFKCGCDGLSLRVAQTRAVPAHTAFSLSLELCVALPIVLPPRAADWSPSASSGYWTFSSVTKDSSPLANAIQTECVFGSTASVWVPAGVATSPSDFAASSVSCKTESFPCPEAQ